MKSPEQGKKDVLSSQQVSDERSLKTYFASREYTSHFFACSASGPPSFSQGSMHLMSRGGRHKSFPTTSFLKRLKTPDTWFPDSFVTRAQELDLDSVKVLDFESGVGNIHKSIHRQ